MAPNGPQQPGIPSERTGVQPTGQIPRRTADWFVLVIALAAIVAGLVLGHALLVAGGLVLAASIRRLFRWPRSASRSRKRLHEP
ncbi:hypothetical protein [Saccharopolyspora spinosa]|uniref:Uncharacterized protein n=1 Tax=Saccharopolyspora spinosa TaxID=60894 RepID=A0A2N3Y4T5_SACSN|nr:hypothetical protein [Saccharopolyspora spinosa]PKW17920.1 hypothetical protein A8926_5949 [Saccharopolyspora spinosa]